MEVRLRMSRARVPNAEVGDDNVYDRQPRQTFVRSNDQLSERSKPNSQQSIDPHVRMLEDEEELNEAKQQP